MITAILGTKSHMEQAFTQSGHRVAVTVVKTAGNIVTQVKTQDHDGYPAVQLGIGEKKAKHTSKQLQGHFSKIQNKNTYPRFIKEVKGEAEGINVGQTISPGEVLELGDLVRVTGISKGKGFAGGVKRWGFAGGPKTHGQSDRHRAPGSIGQGTTPGRVYKGKKMAGRMGGEAETVRNLSVLKIEKDGSVWLSGPVPGNKGGFLYIEKIGRAKHIHELFSKDTSEEELVKALEQEAEVQAANIPQIEGPSDADAVAGRDPEAPVEGEQVTEKEGN